MTRNQNQYYGAWDITYPGNVQSTSEPKIGRADSRPKRAIEAFKSGQPVLIYDDDDREGEVDLVYPANQVTPTDVSRLRNDAGGLICVALSSESAAAFDLPFLHDIIDHPSGAGHDLSYDERSSFSLTVNYRETETGITDHDRALTIQELSRATIDPETVDFGEQFRAPGHVHLLRAAEGLLDDRHGHTELGIALAHEAGQPPAVVVCEMLDDRTGEALSRSDARKYARESGLIYVDGDSLIDKLR
jgi:3,4-dihydroxy 2-butanone 4-phosphate synthase